MIPLRILLFAGLAEACGTRALELSLELPVTTAELRSAAQKHFPQLNGRVFRVSVNARYAADEDAVSPGAEVAFLPPVSGG
jgi:molybdopterin converting factor subunit 1